jgi:lipoprotein-releasing system permease protein
MFNAFERAVAGRYLRARRGERFVSIIAILSLIGIALGVATLIITMSIFSGLKTGLLDRILGFNGHLGIYAAGAPLTNYDELAGKIRAVPGVVSAVPVVDGQVLLTDDHGTNAGGYVRGVSLDNLRALHVVSDHITRGNLNNFQGNDVILIGRGVAERFGIGVGGSITLLSPQGAATAFGTVPRVKAYRVVGIFNVGMLEYDNAYVFLPIEAAQIFFQKPAQATQIEVRVDDPDNVAIITDAIRKMLAGVPVRIVNWQQNYNGLIAALTSQQTMMFIVLMLIVMVAAFNVISSMIMMVKDKARDIAVLRTVGAARGAVMRIFILCGASVGVIGTTLGTILGIVFCLHIQEIQAWVERVTGQRLFPAEAFSLTYLPARLDPREIIQVVIASLALSLLATLYPSWRAAQTDPVVALRNE